MKSPYVDLEFVKFVLFKVHQADQLTAFERFSEYDQDTVLTLLQSIKDFADRDLYPFYKVMDDEPVRFVEGEVIVHPQIERIIAQAHELGLFCPMFDYEEGGMQLPNVIYTTLWHLMDSANNHVTGYVGLTNGAANLIRTFGSSSLIDKYVPNMMAGNWMGTMALTEPQAGSSLSDITTTAYPQADGTYKIKGQKIFISGGDHQYSENFIHLTLARIEGAPAGTKGISLFVVPKKRTDAPGTLVSNDLITAGEIEKLGQRGYVTTHLVYGEHDNCVGELVGKPHHGLKYMFQMMNEARISVGISAASMATAAYHASYHYAHERRQGRLIQSSGKKDVHQEQVLIAQHPDVRRMLLLQQAITQGAVSLVLEAAKLADLAHVQQGKAASEAHLLLELLTPVAKTYPSEMGAVSINNGLQVLGGYGYTVDFILQQYYRDIRITSIYEGTTGIQSLDLLGRKIPMEEGRALELLVSQINAVIDEARTLDECAVEAGILSEQLNQILDCVQYLSEFAKEGDFEKYLGDATIFMQMFGYLLVGWQWLKMGTSAAQELEIDTANASFYQQQLKVMRFYFKYEMPKILACLKTLRYQEQEVGEMIKS